MMRNMRSVGSERALLAVLISILLCLLGGCIQISGGEKADAPNQEVAGADTPGDLGRDDSSDSSDAVQQDAPDESTPAVEPRDMKEYTGNAELDAILNQMVAEGEAASETLSSQLEVFLAAADDSYEGYQANKQMLAEWYATALSESEKLYSSIQDGCAKYHEVLRSSDEFKEYKAWDRALDKSYGVWNDVVSDYYGEWNDLFQDAYDNCSDMITDASSDYSYKETSAAWDEMYDLYSDSWEDMYDLYSDSWGDMYDAHTDIWEELYDRS